MINLVRLFYSIGSGGISPIRLRAKSTSIGFLCNGLLSLGLQLLRPIHVQRRRRKLGHQTGFSFAGLSLIASVVMFLEIPEMKDLTYSQLDEMFEKRVPTRAFARYQTATGPQMAQPQA